jgi:hypothetical protein
LTPVTDAARRLRRFGRVVDVICIASIPALCIVAPGLLPLSALSCAAMAVSDLVGTLLMRAESLGREDVAGEMDRLCTVAKIVLYSYSAERLAHYGWHGWLAMMPILLVDKVATRTATVLSRRMHPYREDPS